MRPERIVQAPPWRAEGVHWHAYRAPGAVPAAPTDEERARRLTLPPHVTLCTPHAVSGWITRQLPASSIHVALWAPDRRRWVPIGDAGDWQRVRLEFLLQAARGEDVYAAAHAPGGNLVVFGEFVTTAQCAEHTRFTESLPEHYRTGR
ncbi:hypothetical protein GCM10027521_25790 [Amycolatopsis cihanbeyliensis]